MTEIDFQSAVIERSHSIPVVVDFWAEWCGPCRVLGPTIEGLAAGAQGRWELVKIDTEKHPELAEAYEIVSIPAVKMFREGRVVAEFNGALPRTQIEQWLDENIPDARQESLDALAARWPAEGGAALIDDLEAFLVDHPDFAPGRLRLAQAMVAQDPARAREIAADGLSDPELGDLATDIVSLADLQQGSETPAEPLATHIEGARKALGDHDLDAAIRHLIEAAMIDKHFAEDLPRRAAVALLRLVGPDHPLNQEHRGRLAMAIHS